MNIGEQGWLYFLLYYIRAEKNRPEARDDSGFNLWWKRSAEVSFERVIKDFFVAIPCWIILGIEIAAMVMLAAFIMAVSYSADFVHYLVGSESDPGQKKQ